MIESSRIEEPRKIDRNHYIDLLRFVFMMVIVLFHQSEYCMNVFSRGNMAVNFFFILSGYLASQSIKNHIESNLSYGNGCMLFMKRKILAVQPDVILTSAIFAVTYILISSPGIHAAVSVLIKTFFSDVLFLRMTGIEHSVGMGYGWYISSMLLGLFVLYPFLRIKGGNIYFLLVSVIIYGYIKLSTGTLMPHFSQYNGITYYGNFMALGGLTLGMGLSSIDLSRSAISKYYKPVALVVLGICLCCLNTPFSEADKPHTMDTLCLFSIAFLILLSVNCNTNKQDSNSLVRNRLRALCVFLGRLSLPLYLVHLSCHMVLRTVYPQFHGFGYMVCYLSVSLLMAYLVMLAARPLRLLLTKWYG